MSASESKRFDIKRRSSAHSAYWMSNALVPAGLILIYRNGWSFEALLGLLFIGIGSVSFVIYRQKMSVPLISYDGQYLLYSPSASKPGTIKMDANAKFTVHELGLTAETFDNSTEKIEISLLNFDSRDDWLRFVEHLKHEPDITVVVDKCSG